LLEGFSIINLRDFSAGENGKHTNVTDGKKYFPIASMHLNYLEGEFVLVHDLCLKSAV